MWVKNVQKIKRHLRWKSCWWRGIVSPVDADAQHAVLGRGLAEEDAEGVSLLGNGAGMRKMAILKDIFASKHVQNPIPYGKITFLIQCLFTNLK
jgi:hypothetical protein